MTPAVVTEAQFQERLAHVLRTLPAVRSVSGPGRSGAIASVYASHFLHVPWLPARCAVPAELRPHLVIDTAVLTGATLRKAVRYMSAEYALYLFHEPPRVRFWYEAL